jgi:uncharacterized protein (DUF1810 family)
MWFVFPQLRGLGRSAMAQKYGIGSLDEARACLAHPVLGPRLIECTRAELAIEGRTKLASGRMRSPSCATKKPRATKLSQTRSMTVSNSYRPRPLPPWQ